jgi:CheY-like chemotaxis protein
MKKYKKTLLVEDDYVCVLICKKFFKRFENFDIVETAENGLVAYDLLCQWESSNSLPDLILLDLNMPVMDGWEFLEKAKGLIEKHQIHLVILTSSIDPMDLRKASIFSCVKEYINKPIDMDKICEIVGEAMEKS